MPEQRVARLDSEDRDRRGRSLGEDVSHRPDDDPQTAAEDHDDVEPGGDGDEPDVDDDDDDNPDEDELEDLDETTDPGAEPGKPV